MNILETADGYLLELTEKIARFVYRWIGVNNFQIAKVLFSAATFFFVWRIFLGFYFQDSITDTFLNYASFFWIIILGMCYFEIEEVQKLTYKFRNFLRLKNRLNRQVFLLIVPFLYINFIPNSGKFDPVAICGAMLVWFYLSTEYFMAIEPEPPSESKLKKGINRLRSLLTFSSPLPSPA